MIGGMQAAATNPLLMQQVLARQNPNSVCKCVLCVKTIGLFVFCFLFFIFCFLEFSESKSWVTTKSISRWRWTDNSTTSANETTWTVSNSARIAHVKNATVKRLIS